jgi:penicillin-binding protein 2
VAFAPYDAPRYAVSVVIEHGNAGAAAAAPMARDIMIDTLGRDPANRTHPPGAEVAQGRCPAEFAGPDRSSDRLRRRSRGLARR